MQARLTAVLGLHRTSSKVSINSITSFVQVKDTGGAYRQFCETLHQIGVTEDMIRQKENEILEILRPAVSSQISSSNIRNQGCSHARNSFLVHPTTDVVILEKLNLHLH